MDRRDALAEIQKATIDTSAGGLLTTEQSKQFILDATESSTFGSKIRLERRRADSGEINKLGVGSRLLRGKSENADDGYRAGLSADEVEYDAKKVWLPFEMTNDWAHENIEGEAAKAKVIKEVTDQLGRDLDDLDINGDTSSGNAFLSIDNGLCKLASTNTSGDINRVDGSSINSGVIDDAHFIAAANALPNKYWNMPDLAWFASPARIRSYIQQLMERETGVGDAALMGKGINPLGVPFFAGQDSDRPGVPYMPDDRIILTSPKNLVRVVTWDIRKYSVKPETDWELATRDKEGHVFFLKRDFVILEDEAVADIHTLDAVA